MRPILARGSVLLSAVTPHRFAFQKFAAQNRSLQFDTLGKKGIGVAERRNGLKPGSLGRVH